MLTILEGKKKSSQIFIAVFYLFCFVVMAGFLYSFNYAGQKYQEYSYELAALKDFSKYKDVYMTNV